MVSGGRCCSESTEHVVLLSLNAASPLVAAELLGERLGRPKRGVCVGTAFSSLWVQSCAKVSS